MSNVLEFKKRDFGYELKMPETATIIELGTMGKIWLRTGAIEGEKTPFSAETFLFIEIDGELHVYQKGTRRMDHLFFWILATEPSGENTDLKVLDFLWHGEWVDDSDNCGLA